MSVVLCVIIFEPQNKNFFIVFTFRVNWTQGGELVMGSAFYTFKEWSPTTELNRVEEARFELSSLPWFDTYVNLYWYFNLLLETRCLHFLSSYTTKLKQFIKQQKICEL